MPEGRARELKGRGWKRVKITLNDPFSIFTYDLRPARFERLSILGKPFAHCVPRRNLIPTTSQLTRPSFTLNRAHPMKNVVTTFTILRKSGKIQSRCASIGNMLLRCIDGKLSFFESCERRRLTTGAGFKL